MSNGRIKAADFRRAGSDDTVEMASRSRKDVAAPPPDRLPELWIHPAADAPEVSGEDFIFDYTVSGHAYPGGPAIWTGRKARNSIEIGNTSSSASGFTIGGEGDCTYSGIEPAPDKYWRTGPPVKIDDDWVYFFEWPNVPIIDE